MHAVIQKSVIHSQDPKSQRIITKPLVKNLWKSMLGNMRGFRYQIIPHITFRKDIENNGTKYFSPIYFNSKPQKVISDSDIKIIPETSCQIILSKSQKWLGDGLGWL